MFRLRRKPAKQSSALKGQKPKRRGESTEAKTSWYQSKITLILFAAIVIGAICWSNRGKIESSWNQTRQTIGNALVLAPSEWTIHMTAPDGTPLNDEIRKEILKVSHGILKSGSPAELEDLNHAVESLGSLENLHIIRPQYATLVISAGVREPVLLVQAGAKVRYLTAEGTVYGDASVATSNQSGNAPTILLNGVFENRGSNLQLDRTARVVTTPEEQATLANAISLWRQCASQNLALKSMSYQKFRGFDIKLEDGSEVTLGTAPFEYKVEKLVGIFAKLRKQGVAAARIELDYDGKAFIKERKL